MKVHKEELRKIWELNPVWDVLTDEQKQFIDSQIEVVSYKKNEIIHHEGDVPTHMLMLVSGKIRIYKEGTGQRQQIIRVLKPYDFFGYRVVPYRVGTTANCMKLGVFPQKRLFLNIAFLKRLTHFLTQLTPFLKHLTLCTSFAFLQTLSMPLCPLAANLIRVFHASEQQIGTKCRFLNKMHFFTFFLRY